MEQKSQKQEKEITATYSVAGQELKLNANIVRQYLVHSSKGTVITDGEIVNFISLCKYNALNPFIGEAYLVKYGDTAQMVVSEVAFLKRADACPDYNGITSGLVVQRGDEVIDLPGAVKKAEDVLLGAWATVYRKDRDNPSSARVLFSEYNKSQSTWKTMPCTMIVKVAKVHALREAFPTQLGALYTKEEQNIIEGDFEEVKKEKKVIDVAAEEQPEQKSEEAKMPDTQPGDFPEGPEEAPLDALFKGSAKISANKGYTKCD